jgi:hypothetical protein
MIDVKTPLNANYSHPKPYNAKHLTCTERYP